MSSNLVWFVGGIVATYALLRSNNRSAQDVVSRVDSAVVKLWGLDASRLDVAGSGAGAAGQDGGCACAG